MRKLIRTILVIVICVAASTATTVLLMFRYTKPIENSTSHDGTVTSGQVVPEQHSVASIDTIAEMAIPAQEQHAESLESVRSQPDAHRYFDYALLSRDIEAFSATVSSFNEMLSHEIQKLKAGASSKDNASP